MQSPFLCCVHRRLNEETSSLELWLLRSICMCKRFPIRWWYYTVGAIYWCTDETIATCWRRTCLDMALNASKSVCIRYGPRFDSDCSEISTNDGDCLRSVSTCRYLGVFTARCICISAVYAAMRCLSVRLSFTFVSCAKTNKDIFEFFSPPGSHTILDFPYQTGWRYSDGDVE